LIAVKRTAEDSSADLDKKKPRLEVFQLYIVTKDASFLSLISDLSQIDSIYIMTLDCASA